MRNRHSYSNIYWMKHSNRAVRFCTLLYTLLFWWPGCAYFVLLSVINYIFSVYSRAWLKNSSRLTFFIHSCPFCLKRWISSCSDIFIYGIFYVGSEVFLTLGDNVWQKNICKYVFLNACKCVFFHRFCPSSWLLVSANQPSARSSVELENALCRVKQMHGTDSTLFI